MTELEPPIQEEKEKRPVGRPKLPETIVKELNQVIMDLQHQIDTANEPKKEMLELAEIIRVIQRAMKGLAADDDVYSGLIDPKKIQERTRLDDIGAFSHSAMREAAKMWPEFGLFDLLADQEDHYLISGDNEEGGLGRKEGILLRQAQTKADNLILNMPNTQGGVAQTEQSQAAPPKKKGFFNKLNPFKR